MNERIGSRNHLADLWKIYFTFCIAIYHLLNQYNIDTSLYIGVEFFFMLSGYFLVMNQERNAEKDQQLRNPAWSFTRKKIARFFPHCLFAYLLLFCVKNYYAAGFDLLAWGKNFINHLVEMFLIWPIGLNKPRSFPYGAAPWYLAVLFICGYLIYFCLTRWKKVYIQLIAPFSVILIYAWFYRTLGSMHHAYETTGFISSYLLRGFADMNLGILCYQGIKAFREKRTVRHAFVPVFWCVVLIALTTALAAVRHRDTYDFLMVAFLALCVLLTFSVSDDDFPNNRLRSVICRCIDFMAPLSFSIYMNHQLIRLFMKWFFPELSVGVTVLYLIIVTVYSFFTMHLVNYITRKIRTLWNKQNHGKKE